MKRAKHILPALLLLAANDYLMPLSVQDSDSAMIILLLLMPGLTLAVSPLISLMKDQVAALNGAGIPAALLNSSLDEASYRETCWQPRQGMHKLL